MSRLMAVLLVGCNVDEVYSAALRHAAMMARRTVLHSAAAATLVAAPQIGNAQNLVSAYFSAGDPRFLQPYFDEIKYKGVKKCEVGKLGATPSLRVIYDADKCSYKQVVGTFWRSCDPTSLDQFGVQVPPVIWTASPEEQRAAQESKRRLQLSTEYSTPTAPPMFRGRPIVADVRTVADYWEAADAADQDWYLNEAKQYQQVRKKSGRAKWSEDAFKPVTVTACEKKSGEGAICGYVYFPCSEENGCSAVTKGAF